jgi:hypothetical protein
MKKPWRLFNSPDLFFLLVRDQPFVFFWKTIRQFIFIQTKLAQDDVRLKTLGQALTPGAQTNPQSARIHSLSTWGLFPEPGSCSRATITAPG